jgi:tetratricopeptide (TPR) repeat protein
VKKPQWITVIVAVVTLLLLYFFGKTVPTKKPAQPSATVAQTYLPAISADTIISNSKRQLSPLLLQRVSELDASLAYLEKNPETSANRNQKLDIYHRLAHFWKDTARIFAPYAWYEAQAARLENSEKTLTFAAHLFLENLQEDNDTERVKWKALQAKDLFERSLKINPANDSARIGLGACYLFGHISAAPMEGINMIRDVAERDSTNMYAQMMLAKGALISGQYDKAITRLNTVARNEPANMEAIIMLADIYERTGDKENAIIWYSKSLKYITREDAREEISKRIEQLQK